MARKGFNIVIILMVVSLSTGSIEAQKTDTIIHVNGSILKVELKKLNFGVLTYKMDGTGVVTIEEVKIRTLISNKMFEIILDNGIMHYGSFAPSHESRKVYIVNDSGKLLINVDDILEAYPIKDSFWKRTSGSFSLGINYSKGSNVATLAFSGNLNYRKQKNYVTLSWDSNNTYQSDSLSSTKSDVALTWEHLLKNEWSTLMSYAVSQNSELGTKLRQGLNLLGARNIVYNKWNRLYAAAGMNLILEKPYDDSGTQADAAGALVIYWKVYKYTNPKIWVDANIAYVPYLTDDRQRLAFNFVPQISILSNYLKFGLNFYYNYDSKPTSTANNNDYGLNLQLTYSFH